MESVGSESIKGDIPRQGVDRSGSSSPLATLQVTTLNVFDNSQMMPTV
jgi:hypothetical protein